ncbi:sensor domain-containing diguanylate cyclase [Vibrio sp. 1CM24A]|uniref:sensor domain-containing diguanylate cyclase n=1 Tax=Vibrio sp. 1CM24A TaxID=2929165 RepID=UPI0020C0D784|nr:sensor domain-containing diguanylate cyclase [Vibrio sp. 1CM24A]MCK8083662.1 GGDEF domain-containing protein [Vibrio sp. 1CM24A]
MNEIEIRDDVMEKDTIGNFNLETMLGVLPDHIFVISADSVFLKVYGGTDINIEYVNEQLIGKSFYDLFSDDLPRAKHYHGVIQKAIETGETQNFMYELGPGLMPNVPTHVTLNNHEWYEGRIQRLPEDINGEPAVVWIVRNVTESERAKLDLKKMSEVDYLTNILNKRSFTNKAVQRLNQARQTPSTLLLLDIDHFKSINDQYGHLVGGEEFAVLLTQADFEQAVNVAEHIRKAIESDAFNFSGEDLPITISIGLSQAKQDERDIKELYHRADVALYTSKNHGRNQVKSYAAHLN